MDARIKSGHDKRVCIDSSDTPSPSRDATRPGYASCAALGKAEGAGNAGRLAAPTASYASEESIRA